LLQRVYVQKLVVRVLASPCLLFSAPFFLLSIVLAEASIRWRARVPVLDLALAFPPPSPDDAYIDLSSLSTKRAIPIKLSFGVSLCVARLARGFGVFFFFPSVRYFIQSSHFSPRSVAPLLYRSPSPQNYVRLKSFITSVSCYLLRKWNSAAKLRLDESVWPPPQGHFPFSRDCGELFYNLWLVGGGVPFHGQDPLSWNFPPIGEERCGKGESTSSTPEIVSQTESRQLASPSHPTPHSFPNRAVRAAF